MTCTMCSIMKRTGREHTRMKVRERDAFTCQECNASRTPRQAKNAGKRLFDVHHLNGLCGKLSRSYDRVDTMGGLITLCHKCHFKRHDWGKKPGGRVMNKNRDSDIKERYNNGRYKDGENGISLARFYRISPQRIYQILKQK